jgi:hypothetical protein
MNLSPPITLKNPIKMFITNVVVDEHILDRGIFRDLKEALDYAQETTKHKVWEVGNGQFYYGNVETKVYELNHCVSSDYKDEHIFSFSRPIKNSTNVV